MVCVLVALRAMLLDLKAVRVIAAILARNVVTVFALFACQSDLWSNIVASHCRAFRLGDLAVLPSQSCVLVPRAGLEPATQRL